MLVSCVHPVAIISTVFGSVFLADLTVLCDVCDIRS